MKEPPINSPLSTATQAEEEEQGPTGGFNPGRSGGCMDCEMSNACESCMMWGEHYYWNHTSDEKKMFLAVASDDFRHSLRISREVGSHLRSMISETVKLEAPNGRIYHIGICREMGELVLRSGWDEFVTAHHIEENYSFLFMYRGDSSLKVHIFNSAGHEKSSSCSQLPSTIFGAVPPCAPCGHVLNASGRSGGCMDCEMSGDFCTSCMIWGEHYYWNHMSDEKKQFLAVALGDFRHSLRISREVGSHLRSMISETVKLDARNGCIYNIGVCREMGELVLRSGWDEFVTAHHIEENYSFLFLYRGDHSFKVHIFNLVGHEQSSSCSQLPSKIFGAVPPSAPCDHHVLNEQVAPSPGHVQTSTDFGYTMLPGCRLTKAQDEKVLEIARIMRSEIPLYVAAMNKSNVSLRDCSINIPLRLVDHFKKEMTKATIQLEAPDCNVYNVGASKHSDDQIVLQSGWDTFVVSHRVQKNDFLIFRSKGKTRLEVLILDPSGRQKTSSCFVKGDFSCTQEMCEDSVEITDPPPHTVIYLSSSDDDYILGENTRKSCRWQKRVPGCCAKTEKMVSSSFPSTSSGYEAHKPNDGASMELGVDLKPLSSNNLEGPSQRPYILTQGITLTGPLKMKVEEKVQAIQSELPIFVAVMTIRSSFSLRFCTEYGSRYIPDRNQPLVLQLEGSKMEWHTRLYIDGRRSRWISKGWSEFASDNHLQLGDICLFELTKRSTEGLSMTVYFIRKSAIEL